MEAAERILMREKQSRKRRMLFGSVGLATVVLIIIIVLAATLSKKHTKKGKTTVLVPLYIYPDAGAWDPLFEAITAHPRTNFTVVINPNSGPVTADKLDQKYKTGVQRLNSFRNVKTIGYVSTDYSRRDIYTVLADMSTYASWGAASTNGSFGVHGVFFDEVVANHTEGSEDFMPTVDRAVKTSAEFKPQQMVVHNNGVIPAYPQESTTDLAVVFEGTYLQYKDRQHSLSVLSKEDRSKRCFLVHSLPLNQSKSDLKKLVTEMSQYAGSLYLTDLSEDYYQRFGMTWKDFIDAAAS